MHIPSSGLVLQKVILSNAPGAIYEASSDIFGYFAEGDNDPDWQHGEDNHASPIRMMSDPNSKGIPTGVNDTIYYYDFSDPEKTWDNGGVHRNNSVISYPCYQMWNNALTRTSSNSTSES